MIKNPETIAIALASAVAAIAFVSIAGVYWLNRSNARYRAIKAPNPTETSADIAYAEAVHATRVASSATILDEMPTTRSDFAFTEFPVLDPFGVFHESAISKGE